MRVHFIAIGGAAMHMLAIALHKKNYIISGSDDEIFQPSYSRLEKYGLLPKKMGWIPDMITDDIDVIILGMHARKDNPELLKAQQIGLKIFSYPQYLYEQTKNKKRIVIGGSHGKTSITSMIMHVLKNLDKKFDFMVGANIKGFDNMVELDDNNEIAIFEGDEYLSSPIDLRPKFHWYKPNIAVLTGIAWDHINVFPTFDEYVQQFKIFINTIQDNGKLFWYQDDKNLKKIQNSNKNIDTISYNTHKYFINDNNDTCVEYNNKTYTLNIFGNHNLQNINAALLVCKEIGISEDDFWTSIQNFHGAAKRLQLIKENKNSSFFIDFAHSPSKLKATVDALKQKHDNRKLIACIELHTFSSLQKDFIPQYKDTMKSADIAIVYYSHQVIKHKNLPQIQEDFVKQSFGNNVKVITNSDELKETLLSIKHENTNILMMSSGNFDGINFEEFANKIII